MAVDGRAAEGLKLATLSPEGRIEYLQPAAYHAYDHCGRLYHVASTQVDLLVTDNHRLWAQPRGRERYALIEASQLIGKRYRLASSGVWEGKDPEQVANPWPLAQPAKGRAPPGSPTFQAVIGGRVVVGSGAEPRPRRPERSVSERPARGVRPSPHAFRDLGIIAHRVPTPAQIREQTLALLRELNAGRGVAWPAGATRFALLAELNADTLRFPYTSSAVDGLLSLFRAEVPCYHDDGESTVASTRQWDAAIYRAGMPELPAGSTYLVIALCLALELPFCIDAFPIRRDVFEIPNTADPLDNALAQHRSGRIRGRPGDWPELVSHLRNTFDERQIVVLVRLQNQVRPLAHRLAQALGGKAYPRRHGTYQAAPKVRVARYDQLRELDHAVVLWTDATDYAKDYLRYKTRLPLGADLRLYGIEDPDRRSSRNEKLAAQAFFGPVIAEIGPETRTFTTLEDRLPARCRPGRHRGSWNPERKRSELWQNPRRNQHVALLAKQLAAADPVLLQKLGAQNPASPREPGTAVAVLVENREHALVLLRLLSPGTQLLTQAEQGDWPLGPGSIAVVTAGFTGTVSADTWLIADGTSTGLEQRTTRRLPQAATPVTIITLCAQGIATGTSSPTREQEPGCSDVTDLADPLGTEDTGWTWIPLRHASEASIRLAPVPTPAPPVTSPSHPGRSPGPGPSTPPSPEPRILPEPPTSVFPTALTPRPPRTPVTRPTATPALSVDPATAPGTPGRPAPTLRTCPARPARPAPGTPIGGTRVGERSLSPRRRSLPTLFFGDLFSPRNHLPEAQDMLHLSGYNTRTCTIPWANGEQVRITTPCGFTGTDSQSSWNSTTRRSSPSSRAATPPRCSRDCSSVYPMPASSSMRWRRWHLRGPPRRAPTALPHGSCLPARRVGRYAGAWNARCGGGTYRPGPSREVKIPRPGKPEPRIIHIQNVRDRIVARAAVTMLSPVVDPQFSPTSFAFRPGGGVHAALAALEKLVAEQHQHVLAIADIKSAFDVVPLDRFFAMAEETFGREIARFFQLLCIEPGTEPSVGLRQGSPFSPFGFNCYADRMVDQPWSQRHPDVPLLRYADDLAFAASSLQQAYAQAEVLGQLCRDAGVPLKVQKMATLESPCVLVTDLQAGPPVNWLGFELQYHDRLEYRIGPSSWETLENAFANCHENLECSAPERAHSVALGWLSWLAPAYEFEDVPQAICRLRAIGAQQGFAELPPEQELQEFWAAAASRWRSTASPSSAPTNPPETPAVPPGPAALDATVLWGL